MVPMETGQAGGFVIQQKFVRFTHSQVPSPPAPCIGCPDCGLIQRRPACIAGGTLRCAACARVLERVQGDRLDILLAFSAVILLLLFPANLLPLLSVRIAGVENSSIIASGVSGCWRQHWPLLAIIVGLEIIVLPFIRYGLLTAVLAALRLRARPGWLGPALRWSQNLDQWAMPDVFLFGSIVGYARVAPFLPVHIGAGGYCLITAALMIFITRTLMGRRALWLHIGPAEQWQGQDAILCQACDFPAPAAAEGRLCPRCQARLWRVKPYATMRAMALSIAAFAFYPAAYLYPMEVSERAGTLEGYSIMTGVIKLIQANLYFFGAVVFFASIVIPLLKLFAFAWFGVSIHRRHATRLKLKTRLYRLIDVIGRWSHIDVFTISVFLPLMQLQGLLAVIIGRATPAFLAVVVLTMLATEIFDPRALWHAAARGSRA